MTDGYPGLMPDWLAARAALAGDTLALVAGDRRLSFRDLDTRATLIAHRLTAWGVRPGERVAVLLGNGVPMVELVHGAGRAGAVLVPLNLRLTPPELAWQLRDCRARLLVYDEARAVAARQALAAIGQDTEAEQTPRDHTEHPAAGPGDRLPVVPVGLTLPELYALDPAVSHGERGRIDLAAVHTLIYTSGTTGRPKGALLTYGNHWWSAMGSALNLGLYDDDRWLAVLPLFHVGGLSILMRGVIYGVPVLVHERFDPDMVNRAIDEDGVTVVSLVAATLRRLFEARGERPYPPSLRAVLVGGGPVPPALLQECARRGVPTVQTYGMTETASQAVTLSPADALRKIGSAGKPLLPTELRIEGDGRVAAAGEVGEIVLRGPSITPGYADRPDETRAALRDGWLHTGDMGRLDEDGYLYVVDRRSDLIISGGENVYPAEVEAALLAHPEVAEAGVTGADDVRWGRVPVAYVVLRPSTTAEGRIEPRLLEFVGARLARYKVPARVHVVDALPRNAAGKVLRRRLGEGASTE